ncbi:SOS response-associated peptidase [Paracoccus liaowanqingii]|uniref:Abasic site processing protein n=1 Tax=Paracoccus liaowanqingii TaxID=2560053 RepID=A0A4P7HPN5_9RHOB|nr:SOS response-associated peptidase [Paracoccus liaowanqingii]QBX35241.1 SOS response-associated peptidase [Paracoccus liaowanqingii]
MCNLYANTTAAEAMRRLFKVTPDRDHLGNAEPRPAIFPKGAAPILRLDGDGARRLDVSHWGFLLPQVSKRTGQPIQPRAVNNARDDKLRTSAFWRSAFRARRCLIPASSFCEAKGRSPATHVWFGVTGEGARPPFALAGIWQDHGGEEGERLLVSSMITTRPNALVATVHPDRMPAILRPGDYQTWLAGDPDEAFALIEPYPAEEMVIHQQGVGLKSDPGDDGPGEHGPKEHGPDDAAPDDDAPAQGALF